MKKLITLLSLLSLAATASAQVTFTVLGGTNYNASNGEGCESAFDHNLETKWLAEAGDSYVDLEASEKIRLLGFTLVTANDNDYYGRLPHEWEFYGSNDETAKDDPLGTWDKWKLLEDVLNDNTVQQANYTAHYFAINAPSTDYKYFRLKFVNSGWQLSEIIPAYGLGFQPPYTALDGIGDTGESYYNIFDNNTGSKWCIGNWGEGSSVDDALWWVVFKTSSPIAVTGYTFTTANDSDGRDPKNWTLYGSNAETQPGREDASWVAIDSKTDQTLPNGRYTDAHFDVDNPTGTAYKWFKLEITKVRNDGNMTQISEFKFDGLGYDGAEDKLVAYRNMTTWGDGTADRLFDGNPNTKFGGNFTTEGYGSYVTFGPASQQQVSITGYSLQVASNWGEYERIPKSWTLYGGNDENTPQSTWEEIHTVTNDDQLYRDDVSYMRLTRGYYHLDAPSKPYKYFKIVFTENNGDGGLQVSELVLYYPHDVTTNWMELREETSPVFNGVVTVKNAKIKRNITADKWIGLCLPFDYTIPSGWDVREMTSVSGSGEDASMKFASASSIEAGKPYIVKTTSDVSQIDATDVTISSIVTKVSDNGVNMIGNIGQTTIPEGSYYISNQGTLKKLTAATATLKGFRAYFTVDGGSGVKALSFDFDDDATGLKDLNDFKDSNDLIYNLAGQRMSKMQKGINIINGKKILK